MKTTKNFKALENVLEECSKMGDTIMAIYGVNNADKDKEENRCQLAFTGDPKIVASCLAEIIHKSLSEDADNGSIAIANALLNAIVTVLTPKDEISLKFAEHLKNAIDTAAKRRFGKKMAKKIKERADESISAPPDEFDIWSKDCQECEDFTDCLVQALIHQAEKSGIGMITIQTNGKGKARKTKNANKKKDEK